MNLYREPYRVKNGCLYVIAGTGEKMLCNFTAYIVSEVLLDNGCEQTRYLTICGEHAKGYTLREITLSIAEFQKMNWILEHWGTACNVAAGNGNREHLRFAIQSTAEDLLVQNAYSHIGWRYCDEWQYLMPNSYNCVCSDPTLLKYSLAEIFEKKDAAVTLALLESHLAPKEILYPLTAILFAAPLMEFFRRGGFELKTVLAIVGQTGSKKSTLAALFLSHFGNFTHDSLPLSFRDTANSILERLYLLKDVPCVIDDFHPSTRMEESEMTKTAQLLFRAFGDKTARGRMRSDLSIAHPKPPRGCGIITAESSPAVSESGSARYLSLPLHAHDMDIPCLSYFQEKAREGTLQKSMAGYIEFLKEQHLCEADSFIKLLREKLIFYRKEFRNVFSDDQVHDRIPEALGYLAVGFHFLTGYFIHCEVLEKEQADRLQKEMFSILCTLGKKQNQHVKTDRPHAKFLQKLSSLIASGQLYFAPKGSLENTRLTIAGYQDEKFYYLIVDTCHKALKKLCDDQGEHFSVSARGLLQDLCENGFLETNSAGQKTHTLNVGGGQYLRVAFLHKHKMQTFLDG